MCSEPVLERERQGGQLPQDVKFLEQQCKVTHEEVNNWK